MSEELPHTPATPSPMPKSALKKTGRQRAIEMVTGIRPGTTGSRNPRPRPLSLSGPAGEIGLPDLEAQAGGVGGGATNAVEVLR